MLNNKGHGLIIETPTPQDFIFGGSNIPYEILQPTGKWDKFLPIVEKQRKNGLETMACATYATLNVLEILHNRLYGIEKNWSERFTANLSGTTRSGNSPHKTAECIRKKGAILEELLPFSKDINTWEEYYAPISENLIKEGEKWGYEILHEYVSPSALNRTTELKEALKYSPLGASVALYSQKEGVYQKGDFKDDHWICIYAYEDNEYWNIFDSYDGFCKRVEWNYPFMIMKRYWLNKKTKIIKKGWLEKVMFFLKENWIALKELF